MNLISSALWIARKDLRTYFRDRTGMALGFLLPIVLVTVFGFVMKFFAGGDGGMPRATLWVADEDATEESRQFVDGLRQSDMIRVRPGPNQGATTGDAIRTKITDGDAHHGLVLVKGFADSLRRGEPPAMIMVRDPGREMEDRITRVAILQAFMAASQGKLWPHTLGSMMEKMGMDEAQVQAIVGFSRSIQSTIAAFAENQDAADEGSGSNGPTPDDAADTGGFDFSTLMEDMVPVTNEDLTPPARPKRVTFHLAQSVSGVLVMMLMFGLMACGSMLIQERETGTLSRLLTTSAPRVSVLWGKFAFAVVIGVIQLLVLAVYGEIVFRVSMFRDPLTFAVISLTWVFNATSFGVLIAAWAKTQKQAEGLSTLLILIMAALGGCWFPIQLQDLPIYADIVTRSTLTYWAMSAYQGMLWNGHDLFHPRILTCLAVLWGFTVVAAFLSSRLYRRRYVAG